MFNPSPMQQPAQRPMPPQAPPQQPPVGGSNFTMNEVPDLTAKLSMLPAGSLQQFAQLHKGDPYVMALVMSESNRRKALQQAGQQPQGAPPKVVDQAIASLALPEDQGLARLPAPNMAHMADGGIAGYDDGEDVQSMARGGNAGSDPFAAALILEGITDPRQIAYLRSIHGQESGGGKNTKTSNRGAIGGMQILPDTFKSVADAGMDIKDPVDNARAGIRYAMQGYQAAQGNPTLAAAYYYGGPSGLEKAKKGVAVSDPKNPNNPNTLEYGKSIAKRMTDLLPIGSAQAAETTPKNKMGLGSLPAAQETDLSGPMEFSVPQGSAPGQAPTPAPTQKAEPTAPTKPWYDRYREALTSGEGQRQMLLGAGDLPYNIAGAPADIGSAISKSLGYKGGESYLGSKNLKRLGTEYLGREADSTDPTLRGMREVGELGSLAIDPFAATKRVVQGAQGMQDLAAASRARAAQADKSVSNLRLEPPRAEPPVMVVGPKGGAMPADSLRRVEQAMTDEARAAEMGRIAAHNERAATMAPNAEQRAAMLGKAGMYDAARGAAGAAAVGNVRDSDLAREFLTAPTNQPTTGKERGAYLPEGLPAYTAEPAGGEMGPPESAMKKPEAAQGKSTGLTDDDLVMLGLGMMASKSPNLLQSVGESGIGALQAKRAQQKQASDIAHQAAMEKYYGQVGEQAMANADYIRSEKGQTALKMKAMQLAEAEYSKWESNPMGGGLADDATKAAYRQRIFNDYLSRAGLGGNESTMAATAGPKLEYIGSRPG
jgi:hypothetical protein